MKDFKIRLAKKHLLFDYNGQTVLVDTGSPITISESGSNFEFCGEQIPSSKIDFILQVAKEQIGEQIDVFAGLNLLRNFNVLIDYNTEKITFFDKEECIDFESKHQLSFLRPDYITVKAKVADKETNFVFDTGAVTQYILDDYTANMTSSMTATDFLPDGSEFTTPIFSLDAEMNGDSLDMEFGNPQPTTIMQMKILDVQGFLGYDFLSQRRVLLNFKNNTLEWV